MRIAPDKKNGVVDLTADDLRTIIESVQSLSGCWCIRATYAPNPLSEQSATRPNRWAYLFWVGPPSADIVPVVAIARHVAGFAVIVFDPLKFCASGAFEVMECADIAGTIELVCRIIREAREIALDRATPDIMAFASSLIRIHRGAGEQSSKKVTELQDFILASMAVDVLPS